jgi:hypothetical protein
MLIRTPSTAAAAACLACFAFLPLGLAPAIAAPIQSAFRPAPVAVEVGDERGRVLRLQSLSAAEQGSVERLRRTMEGLSQQEAARGRIPIDIHCTRPPLRCVITIGYQAAVGQTFEFNRNRDVQTVRPTDDSPPR